MRIFGMGASWGGYESLIIPAHPGATRSVTPWPPKMRVYRVHIGLEDVEDLRADLADGLDRLKANA
jgi:cystathionine beta-lyase